MKVTVKDRSGREKTMPAAHAKILVKLGRAQYLTRDMSAAPAEPIAPIEIPAEPEFVEDVAEVVLPEEVATEPEVKPKRTYTRRAKTEE